MSARRQPTNDEWQLGPEPHELQEFERPGDGESKVDFSASRLTRPVQVVTVEHLLWIGIAAWAGLSRFLELGMGPLTPDEARHALFEFDLVNGTDWASATGYHPASGGWIHLFEAGLFAAGGTSDSTARLIFALGGLSMIAVAFLMRASIGRAGAIALAGLITISPTFTYFSRTSAIDIVTAAIALAVVEGFIRLAKRPNLLAAIGLGSLSGLLCAAGPAGLASGSILLLALGLLGLYQLIVSGRMSLNLRIWLLRYTWVAVATIIATGLSWSISEMSLFRLSDIWKTLLTVRDGFSGRDYLSSVQYYGPGILLYEVLIVLTTIAGLLAILSLRAWSRLALFSSLWLVMSLLYFLGSYERESARLVLMLLPAVMVSAIGIDYLHHTRAWGYVRPVFATLVIATVYVQVEANLIYAAPHIHEAPWNRHANLYWRDGATTAQARADLDAIRRRFPEEGGTAFSLGVWPPSLRWYLRDFRPASSSKLADLVINSNPPATEIRDSGSQNTSVVHLEQSWEPTLSSLAPRSAIRFALTATASTPIIEKTIAITERPSSDLAPTLVIPPPILH